MKYAEQFHHGSGRSDFPGSGAEPQRAVKPRKSHAEWAWIFSALFSDVKIPQTAQSSSDHRYGYSEVFAFIREYSGNQVSLRHECAKLCNENGIRKRKCRKNKTKIRKHSTFLLAKT